MKEIIVTTQAEFDALPISFDEYTKIIIKGTAVRISVTARGNSSVEARGNSSVEAWGNSSVEAWGNSSVIAWENSSVIAWENSSVEARGNSSVEARGNSSVIAWENSSVIAWGNSSVEARGNSVVRIFSDCLRKVSLYGFAMAIIASALTVKIEKNSEYAHIHITRDLGWFECNAIEKTPVIVLYKRVSKDYKTQEGQPWETTWTIGLTLEHPAWRPAENECGNGKYHACSRPYFCDEFRSTKGDRYVAISIKIEDLYEWPGNRAYPHKIAFRLGTVLCECDKYGKEIKR